VIGIPRPLRRRGVKHRGKYSSENIAKHSKVTLVRRGEEGGGFSSMSACQPATAFCFRDAHTYTSAMIKPVPVCDKDAPDGVN
jgi:hypothetical protein